MHERGYQESSVDKAQRLSCADLINHHHLVIFRCDDSADHHKAVVFRHDDSADRSQSAKKFSSQRNQAQYQPQATEDSVATQRFPVAVFVIQTQEDKSIIVKEDSGEAIDEPDASNNSIQSKSLYESAVATHPEEVAKLCIQSKNEPVAKKLTKSSKKLSKLDVNC
ncbi:hypothetical protein F511_43459 [Dorcoceras hygrometricum]|uniref:Uncharacterized protein n=1 Tax=Dorcoceras hygrometricum TaxID=472368 RepID=A0A2Z7DG93_9LAMI|nr:hypothetical protein F511_43459 [Dorcoceras hygrometricum]